MTKEDIIKALTCCSNPSISYCKDCPYANYGEFDCCNGKMCKDALDLIIEQEREIERLKDKCEELRNEKWNAQDDLDSYCDEMPNKIKRAKIDMLNELKKYLHTEDFDTPDERWKPESEFCAIIDELIKEVQNGEDKG